MTVTSTSLPLSAPQSGVASPNLVGQFFPGGQSGVKTQLCGMIDSWLGLLTGMTVFHSGSHSFRDEVTLSLSSKPARLLPWLIDLG